MTAYKNCSWKERWLYVNSVVIFQPCIFSFWKHSNWGSSRLNSYQIAMMEDMCIILRTLPANWRSLNCELNCSNVFDKGLNSTLKWVARTRTVFMKIQRLHIRLWRSKKLRFLWQLNKYESYKKPGKSSNLTRKKSESMCS